MASPWKFLSRLVSSSRREQKQGDDTVDDAKPGVVAIADPTETLAEESLNPADRPAGVEPPHRDPSASAEPAAADDAESDASDTAESVGVEVAAVGGSTSPDDSDTALTIAANAAGLGPAVEGAARKQRSRDKNTKPAGVIAQVSQGLGAASNETMSLDEEIKVLRRQLASKLQLQNAQLKRMLERFER